MGVDRRLLERQQQWQSRQWPRKNDWGVQAAGGPRRVLARRGTVPTLRSPQREECRRPVQVPGLPVGQDIKSLILPLYVSGPRPTCERCYDIDLSWLRLGLAGTRQTLLHPNSRNWGTTRTEKRSE